jgi:hypothetical protein
MNITRAPTRELEILPQYFRPRLDTTPAYRIGLKGDVPADELTMFGNAVITIKQYSR